MYVARLVVLAVRVLGVRHVGMLEHGGGDVVSALQPLSSGLQVCVRSVPTVPGWRRPFGASWEKNYCKSTRNPNIQWMGMSVRDARWRATLWLPWNGAALAPQWEAKPTAVELWDYEGSDGSDFDSFPVGHINLATQR